MFWIGTALLDSLFSYPDHSNLSRSSIPIQFAVRMFSCGSVNFDWPHGDGLFWPHVYPETGLTESSHFLAPTSVWGF